MLLQSTRCTYIYIRNIRVYIDYKSSNHSENRLSFPFRFIRSYILTSLSRRFHLSFSLSFYLFFETQIYIDVCNIRVRLHITVVVEKNTIVPRTHTASVYIYIVYYTHPGKRKGRRNRARGCDCNIYYTRVRKIHIYVYFGNHCATSTERAPRTYYNVYIKYYCVHDRESSYH